LIKNLEESIGVAVIAVWEVSFKHMGRSLHSYV
jgi:PIN domain nuclease of toxin-antitoxin system